MFTAYFLKIRVIRGNVIPNHPKCFYISILIVSEGFEAKKAIFKKFGVLKNVIFKVF